MKVKSTLYSCSIMLFLFLPFNLFSQTYTFKNASLVSGTALQTGAVYKFPNVKTGTDARITILGSTGNITLTAIDENWTGFDEAFQPFINVGTNANGYVEFQLDFYIAGTTIPLLQTGVPVTCVDVDGVDYNNGDLYEHDQIQFLPGYMDYQYVGSNLSVQSIGGWVSIKNTSGESYDGIDTSAKDVMATVFNRSCFGFKMRIGATNSSSTKSEVRYRSVYFKRFNYGHQEPLAQKTILNLSGDKKTGGNELRVTMGSGAGEFDRMIIERSAGGNAGFTPVGQAVISSRGDASHTQSYWDGSAQHNASYYYRVRLVNSQSGKEELSNTLLLKDLEGNDELKLVNTIVQAGNPSLVIRSAKSAEALVRITDLSGRMLYSGRVKLNTGSNTVTLAPLNGSLSYAVVNIETGEQRKATRILLQ